MRRFVFVTQELSPGVPGGAGTLIAELAAALGRDHDVSVILAASTASVAESRFRVIPVDVGAPDGSLAWFVERSRLVAEALGRVVADRGRPDLVEFTDFEALGFWSFMRRGQLGLGSVPMVVRLHGPFGAISAAVGAAPEPWPGIDVLEREVFAMSDAVIVPSHPVGEWAKTRYSLSADRMLVAPPIVPEVTRREWKPAPEPWIAAYGRLTEAKGVDILVEAAIPLLIADAALRLRFFGPDGWSATQNRPMSDVLRSRVPAHLAHRIEFRGAMERERALDELTGARLVVIPSPLETFCLAAHELRRAGIPILVAAQPAFAELDEAHGVASYDGTPTGLTRELATLLADRNRLALLAVAPAPVVADPIPVYLGDLPPPRHPNAQAGLATAAGHRWDALSAAAPRRASVLARRVLALLPQPVAALAVRVLPKRLKDRFRDVASWPAEVARRERAARWRAVEQRIARGDYPVYEHPEVTVVVPCFNQGRFLGDALLSIFEQTFDSWEVVVVDDGSTEPETIAVLDAIDWPRATLLRQQNTGLPGARNRGIAAASGDFIVPLDADDALLPDYMVRMVGGLMASPEAGYAHCWAELFGDVHRVWATRPFNPYTIRLSNSVTTAATIRREALERVGGYDPTMTSGNEDWDLWLRMLEAGFDNVQVREVLYRYRKHGVSMSVATEADFETGVARLMQRHQALYEPTALRAAKRLFYPAISVITATDAVALPNADIEVLVGNDRCALIRKASGKYIAETSAPGALDLAILDRLVDHLEDAPAVASASEGTLTLARRWALVDPSAPLDGARGLIPCPDPLWMVPTTVAVGGHALDVERQRPEEAARVPRWLLP